MNHSATRTKQRKPHGAGAKPRHMVTQPNAEGLALRTTARLCADSAAPAIRASHRTYMDGFIGALQSIGLLADHRAIVLRNACHGLLDGQITLGDYTAMTATAAPIDPGYVKAVQATRRARVIDATVLSAAMCITPITARRYIQRMVDTGVLNPADMFGVHTLRAVEVSHA